MMIRLLKVVATYCNNKTGNPCVLTLSNENVEKIFHQQIIEIRQRHMGIKEIILKIIAN